MEGSKKESGGLGQFGGFMNTAEPRFYLFRHNNQVRWNDNDKTKKERNDASKTLASSTD